MLTRIRNAALARTSETVMPMSRVKLAIAKILEHEGFIASVETREANGRPMLALTLKYDDSGRPTVTSLARVSKPGRRVYVKADEIARVRSGQGIAIVSTPNGLMTGSEARKRRLGGELICEVF